MSSQHRRGLGDERFYEALAKEASEVRVTHADFTAKLAQVIALLWRAFESRGVSWVGFYIPDSRAPIESLLLAAREPKPACSPIGLHGACGQSFLEEQIRLIEDVALLGAHYVACDPRDRSEIVVPIFRDGQCAGVLDIDSFELACFGQADVDGLAAILRNSGLLDRPLNVRSDCLPKT
ncbi:MAG: hypothetical protein DWH96_09225 [Planctomycetota bacterium]|nr:MAG: hypothetical protein DWH96_09225 [Planctomycetota bacterium]